MNSPSSQVLMQNELYLREYQTNAVGTADQKQLIIMLYEGILRFIAAAESYMGSYRTYDKVNNNILRAQDIFTELMLSLNFEQGGEIAKNLFNLYAYCKSQLLEANIRKKPEPLQIVKKIVSELLDAWKQLEVPKTGSAGKKSEEPRGRFQAEG